MEAKRIMICGASGTGKTTLAQHISISRGIEYITHPASVVWSKYGFINHLEAHEESVKCPEMGLNYQWDVLFSRKYAYDGYDSFIADRSFIDNIVYTLHSIGHTLSKKETEIFLGDCERFMGELCDGLIFCRYTPQVKYIDEKDRIDNPYFHRVIDSIFSWVILDRVIKIKCPILSISTWDFKKRTDAVDLWLKSI